MADLVDLTTLDMTIAKKVRRRRKILGLTQQQVAERVDVRFQQVQKYETAANKISLVRMYQLAYALDTNIAYFLPEYTNTLVDPVIVDLLSDPEVRQLVETFSKLGPRSKKSVMRLMNEFTVD